LTYLARPDNGIYSILFPSLAILLLLPAENRKILEIFWGGILLLLAADIIWKQSIFGSPLPLSYYVKKRGFYQGYIGAHQWNPIIYLKDFWGAAVPFWGIIVLTAKKRQGRLLLAFLLPVILTFICYFGFTQIMGQYARYYYPSLPFIVVSSIICLDRFLNEYKGLRSINARSYSIRVFVVVMTIIFLNTSFFGKALSRKYARLFLHPTKARSRVALKHNKGASLPGLGWWRSILEMSDIARQCPRGTVIAATEYGYLSASSPHVSIIDLAGLNDKYISHYGFSMSYVLSRKPDIIWFPHPEYTHIVQEILTNDGFWFEYSYYRKAFDYGLAIRKRSMNLPEISAVIKASWQKNYPNLTMSDYLVKREDAVYKK